MTRTTWPFRILMLVITACWLSGCQSPSSHVPESHASTSASSSSRLGSPTAVRSALIKQYQSWRGVPYRNGGSTRRGVDCSGFVQLTFRDRFGVELPRDSQEQAMVGKNVSAQRLQPGDLLFFNTGPSTRHVGIFIEKGRFLHASSSKGVMISDLNTPYWRKAYRQSRRL